MRGLSVFLLLVIGCGGAPSLSGAKLPAGALGSPRAQASFGQSVAILGGQVAVGAPTEDGGARDAGRVHVFDRFDGTHVSTLVSPAPVAAGRFGSAIAADAGLLLVGEPGHNRAYLIDAATGEVRATLTGAGDFGGTVAVGGGYACVGAPSRGEVSVFETATGSLLRVLSRSGAFGSALALVGGRLLVGAPAAGRAYLFDLADGSEVLALSGPVDFGAAVAAAADRLLVGAPSARRVFLYDGAGALVRAFDAPSYATSFGTGVAYDDGHVIVGGVAGGVPALFLFDPATGALTLTLQSTYANEGLSFTALGGVALLGLYPMGTSVRPGLAQVYSCDTGGLLQTFTSPGDVPQGGLGASVAFVNGLVAVGAPGEGTGGLVHLFDESGALVRTIQSPSGETGGGFGSALAAVGTTLAVGAPGEMGAGLVHVFDATDGSFLRTLSPPAQSGEFGAALAIDGANIFVGSPGDDVGQTDAGGVHPFVLATGVAGTVHRSTKPEAQGRFGAAVAAEGGDFVAGAPGEGAGQGTAYLIQASDGTVLHTLPGAQLNAGGLGGAVALTKNEVWAGAPDEDFAVGATPAVGAVHVFDRQTGVEANVLHSTAFPAANARFGASIAAGASIIAIGAPGDEVTPSSVPAGGVVYQYDVATGIRARRFVSPVTGTAAGGFGTAVAVSGTKVAIGAPQEDRGATAQDAGYAYLFDTASNTSLYSPQPQDSGYFGWDVEVLDADTLIVGAPFEGSGNVYLIDPGGVQPTITIPAQGPSDQFGYSVGVAAGNVIVSAPSANLGAGEAYLFDPLGNLLQTFQSPDAVANGFGDEVAGLGANVLVGSPFETVGSAPNAGRAYLFAPDGTLLQTFQSPNAEAFGRFGSSVAAFGTDVLVGAPGENSVGRAYLFAPDGTLLNTFDGADFGGGSFGASVGVVGAGILAGSAMEVAVGATESVAGGTVTTIDPSTGAETGSVDNPEGVAGEGGGFGESFVDINGTLAVGSAFGGVDFEGVVFLFGAGGASLGQITSLNPTSGGSFGNTVAAYAGGVVVGAPTEDVNPSAAGRVYVFSLAGAAPGAVFQSPSPVAGGAFGTAVAFEGAVPVVGAPGEDEGVVYVFDPSALQPNLALQAPLPVTGARYGEAVAANFLLLAVGEPGGASGAGRAYLYDASTNMLTLTFDSVFPETGGRFGSSVAVTGANVVVGAPSEDAGATDAGRAYYFDCLVETALQVFESPNPIAVGHFGCAVATESFDVYVGACDEDAGNVYRFAGLAGSLLDTYAHPDPQTGARFGFALAMSGTNLLVGAPGQTVGTATGAGSAYLVNTATGGILLTLTKPVPAAGDGFGAAVAAANGSLFVAAPGAQQGAGEVWEFDAATGAAVAHYTSPNPAAGGVFGAAVAAIQGNLLVGAPGEDGGDTDAGVAYLNPVGQ